MQKACLLCTEPFLWKDIYCKGNFVILQISQLKKSVPCSPHKDKNVSPFPNFSAMLFVVIPLADLWSWIHLITQSLCSIAYEVLLSCTQMSIPSYKSMEVCYLSRSGGGGDFFHVMSTPKTKIKKLSNIDRVPQWQFAAASRRGWVGFGWGVGGKSFFFFLTQAQRELAHSPRPVLQSWQRSKRSADTSSVYVKE